MRPQFLGLITGSILFAVGSLAGCGSDDTGGGSPVVTAGAPGGAGAPAAGAAPVGGAGAPGAGAPSGGSAGAAQAGAAGASVAGAGGSSGGSAGTGGAAGASASGGSGAGGAPNNNGLKVVAYLPNYSGSYTSWANKIDFSKMTHLNLAFAMCNDNANTWNMGASDADVKVLVDKAHAAGVKVLASLGGGGGDQKVIARYKDANNLDAMVTNLDSFVTRLNLDGVDVDIESPENMKSSTNFAPWVQKTMAVLKPKGKLVTTAVAQYIVEGASGYSDDLLGSWDFINVMIYDSKMSVYTNEMKWWTDTKKIAKTKLTIGVPFFGNQGDNEIDYKAILAQDPNAWSKTSTQYNGQTVTYVGTTMMTDLVTLSKGYGGIMFWELTEDATGEHSLWKTIQAGF